jgi:hypothetical protein
MKWAGWGFAAVMGFASVVEWSHMRQYLKSGNLHRVVATGAAALVCGYIASEALEGNWPSWESTSGGPSASA